MVHPRIDLPQVEEASTSCLIVDDTNTEREISFWDPVTVRKRFILIEVIYVGLATTSDASRKVSGLWRRFDDHHQKSDLPNTLLEHERNNYVWAWKLMRGKKLDVEESKKQERTHANPENITARQLHIRNALLGQPTSGNFVATEDDVIKLFDKKPRYNKNDGNKKAYFEIEEVSSWLTEKEARESKVKWNKQAGLYCIGMIRAVYSNAPIAECNVGCHDQQSTNLPDYLRSCFNLAHVCIVNREPFPGLQPPPANEDAKEKNGESSLPSTPASTSGGGDRETDDNEDVGEDRLNNLSLGTN